MISVALLQNEEYKHGILDDRESFFHVLTWFALCYTPHSHRDDVEPHIISYNEVVVYRNGTVRGGFRKRGMIQSAFKVTFHPLALHKLIDDLCILFWEQYRDLTSDAKRFPLNDVDNKSSSQLYAAIEAKHHKRCKAMQAHGAFEYVFRQRLASGYWSEDCATQENYTHKCPALDPPPASSCCSSKYRRGNNDSRK